MPFIRCGVIKVLMPSYYEFFAGGGMARTGLGRQWKCEFANDISPMKAAAYLRNFKDSNRLFALCDINELNAKNLPGRADLIWASFPCQDLSLAGSGKGLNGSRSGLIWSFLKIVRKLKRLERGPKVIVLENVTGLLNSKNGHDFYDILGALRREGFLFGTLMMDAVHFLPHSRPRIFLVAVDIEQIPISAHLINGRLTRKYRWSSPRLDSLWENAPFSLRDSWVWWNIPAPPARRSTLTDIIEPKANNWDSPEYTARLLQLMAPLHRSKVKEACSRGEEVVGTLYRRTRSLDDVRTQRVEVRFDGISGCLRTPSGGSSRQRLLFVSGGRIRSRLLTTREAARLMGVPDRYKLPSSYNEAYQIAGDGVAVPVVGWLAKHLLFPLLSTKGKLAVEDEAPLLYA
ncbi:MAG: DNA cytosine methyltransferase [Acidobacteriaceae bacterium]